MTRRTALVTDLTDPAAPRAVMAFAAEQDLGALGQELTRHLRDET